MSKSEDEFIVEEDIKHNRRMHDVPPLRFLSPQEGENMEIEHRRNMVWEMYLSCFSVREISREVGVSQSKIRKHIKKCKQFYDKWVADNGLELHGDPANRLEDTIRDLENQLKEVQGVAAECLAEGDVRGYKDLQRIILDIRKDIAKFKNVEPPKNLNVNMSSAEETRKMMKKLFPSESEE